MTETFSNNNGSNSYNRFREVLKPAAFSRIKQPAKGYIFQERNFANNWDSIYVAPASLDMGEVNKGMRMITEPTLIMSSHSSHMAYIMASKDAPVYIQSSNHWNNEKDFWMLFNFQKPVLPEYIYYLCLYDSWRHISVSLNYDYGEDYDPFYKSWKDVGYHVFIPSDGFGPDIDYFVEAEGIFLSANGGTNIPSTIDAQKQRIEDTLTVEKHIQQKYDKQEKKFKEKEWLNEEHIRNSKHRLSQHVMPIRMSVERLNNFLEQNTNGVTMNSVIGKATNQTIHDLMKDLMALVGYIEEDVENLTKSETVGEIAEDIDLAKFISDYCSKILKRNENLYSVQTNCFERELKIRIARKELFELLDCIVENAVRHGFVEKGKDYVIEFSIEKIDDGLCRLSIANNGLPMPERGKREYFVRGSFAGNTGHSGIGGARIYEICEKAGGEAMPPSSKENFPVVIIMEFPIAK